MCCGLAIKCKVVPAFVGIILPKLFAVVLVYVRPVSFVTTPNDVAFCAADKQKPIQEEVKAALLIAHVVKHVYFNILLLARVGDEKHRFVPVLVVGIFPVVDVLAIYG